MARLSVRGKYLFADDEKLYVRGVTYGTFRPNGDDVAYPSRGVVEADFAAMAENRINAVRTYTVPPRWVLDLATDHGLYVMVGLAWEQHVAFLDEPKRARSIEERVRAGVRACAGHPAVLCYAVGNEIPASVVRWYGRQRIERFLKRLYHAAKAEDPDRPVTYVNYPSTEYLQLPFLDLVSFNVFLEDEERLEAYLARLQNIAGERPLIAAELGLDSRRHGEEAQALSLDWQIRAAFRSGCVGALVFSWTDEWHRGGHDIDDWGFGLTDRYRRAKPGLDAVQNAFSEVPFRADVQWPRASVIVCTHNGAATLSDCLDGIGQLEYPHFEAIIVDDGSTDETAAIAAGFDVRLIRTENCGLGAARNTGLEAATGQIVAYLDDDARPDRHWLSHLVGTMLATTHAGVGGPNVAPDGEGLLAQAVAAAPGGPAHVLLSDREAEHIPGCNMAFWRERLLDVGGFDPRFRVAGDDVDICWRLHEQGWTLGFSPGAMVWHRRRKSIGAFLRQQRGYGVAEALLERKWPAKYNRGGHLIWRGHVYANGASRRGRWRIYYGTWGTGLFQSMHRERGAASELALMPEWFIVVAALAGCSALGLYWRPLLLALPLLTLSVGILIAEAVAGALHTCAGSYPRSRARRVALHGLTALMYLLQPLGRLSGRLRAGLTPWRKRGAAKLGLPRPRTASLWSEGWKSAQERLRLLEAELMAAGTAVERGGEHDRWDLHARSGSVGAARARMVVEEHGGGKQLVRLRWWPRYSRGGCLLTAALAAGAVAASIDGAWLAAGAFGALALLLGHRMLREALAATGLIGLAFERHALVPLDDLNSTLEQRLREQKRAVALAAKEGR
jgi:O-antigen biosynthesis protein